MDKIYDISKKENDAKNRKIPRFRPRWQPHDGRWKLTLSHLTRNAHRFPQFQEIVQDATEIWSELLEEAIPEVKDSFRLQHWYATALLPFGSLKNLRYFKDIRLNDTDFDDSLANQLNKFGKIHTDMHDRSTTPTCIADVSNPGPNHPPRNMAALPFGMLLPQEANGASFVSELFQHTGTAVGKFTVAKDSPLRPPLASLELVPQLLGDWVKRNLRIILWGNKHCLAPRFRWLDPEWYSGLAAVLCPDLAAFYTWMT